MNNPAREVLQGKLASLQTYYRELAELQQITFEDYLGNRLYKRTVERLLQLIVEAATDINNLVLKGAGKEAPLDYYSSFIELAAANVFPMKFALKIAPSTGLRNIIVHEYQAIDDRVVYASIRVTLKYYLEYMKYLEEYLSTR
ncbi:MAG TPA: DUF86 domain-containing protein [Firmicutes bacterium]|jgi:uncharacterized protein YutE (UPF0331/DUF86 family)|nr:DUF86 domain-containing protein [Bacillota bacterium]